MEILWGALCLSLWLSNSLRPLLQGFKYCLTRARSFHEPTGRLDEDALKSFWIDSEEGQTRRTTIAMTIPHLAMSNLLRLIYLDRYSSLDILGYGGLNDYRKDFSIFRNTTLIVRKDNHTFAELPIRISKKKPVVEKKVMNTRRVEGFVIETRGSRMLISNGKTFDVIRGD